MLERRATEWSSLEKEETHMLRWALIFFVVALVAAVLGFGGIAGSAVQIAKILFFVFLIAAAISFILNLTGKKGDSI